MLPGYLAQSTPSGKHLRNWRRVLHVSSRQRSCSASSLNCSVVMFTQRHVHRTRIETLARQRDWQIASYGRGNLANSTSTSLLKWCNSDARVHVSIKNATAWYWLSVLENSVFRVELFKLRHSVYAWWLWYWQVSYFRCFSDVKTAVRISIAIGMTTKQDLEVLLENSGSVCP